MRIMGHQFVMGRKASLLRRWTAPKKDNRPYRYSYDMLGEAALTQDARRYHRAYNADAIRGL